MDNNQDAVRKLAVEALAREFHAIYQLEAKRQAELRIGSVRHPDNYDDLLENIKDYDRVLAEHAINLLEETEKRVRKETAKRCAQIASNNFPYNGPDTEITANTIAELIRKEFGLEGE